jgi:hypothetical protein
LNCDPPDICLLSNKDYKLGPLVPSLGLVFWWCPRGLVCSTCCLNISFVFIWLILIPLVYLQSMILCFQLDPFC